MKHVEIQNRLFNKKIMNIQKAEKFIEQHMVKVLILGLGLLFVCAVTMIFTVGYLNDEGFFNDIVKEEKIVAVTPTPAATEGTVSRQQRLVRNSMRRNLAEDLVLMVFEYSARYNSFPESINFTFPHLAILCADEFATCNTGDIGTVDFPIDRRIEFAAGTSSTGTYVKYEKDGEWSFRLAVCLEDSPQGDPSFEKVYNSGNSNNEFTAEELGC